MIERYVFSMNHKFPIGVRSSCDVIDTPKKVIIKPQRIFMNSPEKEMFRIKLFIGDILIVEGDAFDYSYPRYLEIYDALMGPSHKNARMLVDYSGKLLQGDWVNNAYTFIVSFVGPAHSEEKDV